MIDFQIYRDEGPITSGRGTPREVTNWNMKDSSAYLTVYYPTQETVGAPLIRPLNAGEQKLSFKVYTFFKLSGSYASIKNLRFRVSMVNSPQASDVQVFFKNTNVYQTPDNAFDGDMILLADKNGVVYSDPIYPMISTVGPNSATTRQTTYNGTAPLYTNYFVTQVRVNKGSTIGNSAGFELKFEAYEYES